MYTHCGDLAENRPRKEFASGFNTDVAASLALLITVISPSRGLSVKDCNSASHPRKLGF